MRFCVVVRVDSWSTLWVLCFVRRGWAAGGGMVLAATKVPFHSPAKTLPADTGICVWLYGDHVQGLAWFAFGVRSVPGLAKLAATCPWHLKTPLSTCVNVHDSCLPSSERILRTLYILIFVSVDHQSGHPYSHPLLCCRHLAIAFVYQHAYCCCCCCCRTKGDSEWVTSTLP